MNLAYLDNGEITSTYTLPLNVAKGSLIDFETTGIPGKDESHEVVTLGYLSGDRLRIIQRKTLQKSPFYSELRETIRRLPHPFYSYNTEFENRVMISELGLTFPREDFVDLMAPWKRKAAERGLKWPRLDELISEPEDYFNGEKITGRQVPSLWGEFLTAPGIERPLERIMEHCFSDLLREATLLLRYPY